MCVHKIGVTILTTTLFLALPFELWFCLECPAPCTDRCGFRIAAPKTSLQELAEGGDMERTGGSEEEQGLG